MDLSKPAADVRALISAERDGMLCTISRKLAGWPFGSIAPYALTAAGEPIILISEIAEHTRNVRADARVSLLIRDSRALDDPQSGARATLMGYVMPVPPPFLESARVRYLELFPNSAGYFEVHDFTLFQMNIMEVRYIGGFGDIHWLSPDAIVDQVAQSALDPLASHSKRICDHMNQDHSDALVTFADRLASTPAESARMIHTDSLGFDVIAINDGTHRHVRIPFPSPVVSPEDARRAMVDLVRRIRSTTST